MTRVQPVNRAKKQLSASTLKGAYPVDVGGSTQRLVAEFEYVTGMAAVRDRRLTLVLQYSELADLLGAVPGAALCDAEDIAAYARIVRLLRRLDGSEQDPGASEPRGDSAPDAPQQSGAELSGATPAGPLAQHFSELDLAGKLGYLYAVLIRGGQVSGFDLGVPFSTGFNPNEIARWLRGEQ